MDAIKANAFFNALSTELEKYTADTVLLENNETGRHLIKSVFGVSPERTNFVLIEANVYSAREDVDLLELFVQLKESIPQENAEELKKAFEELNFYSPAGALGIHPARGFPFLRDCFRLDNGKDVPALVQDAITAYEMILELVMAAYPGLMSIWNGEMTFEQAVEKDILRKHSS